MTARALPFDCAGVLCAGMLHPGARRAGLLIVSGGLQTRVGSHRLFFDLAAAISQAGFPVLRFDRRGMGDSGGIDKGWRSSAPDIGAAAAALRGACPALRSVAGWGLCDGASALALFGADAGLDGLVLANPWLRDEDHVSLPPPAAVAQRYRQRLFDRDSWRRLVRGDIDLAKLARGLRSLQLRHRPTALEREMAHALSRFNGPVSALLGTGDATGIAFAAAVRADPLKRCRVVCRPVADGDHSFSSTAQRAAVINATLEFMNRLEGNG